MNLLTIKKKKHLNKKLMMFFLVLVLLSQVVFAQASGIETLDSWGETIVGLFTSTWLKAICIIALIGLCIGMITAGRQEPGLMKKFAPWMIGVIILLSSTGIVNFFFAGADLGTI